MALETPLAREASTSFFCAWDIAARVSNMDERVDCVKLSTSAEVKSWVWMGGKTVLKLVSSIIDTLKPVLTFPTFDVYGTRIESPSPR